MPNNIDDDSIQDIGDTPESLGDSNGVPSRSAGLGNKYFDFQSNLAKNKFSLNGLNNNNSIADATKKAQNARKMANGKSEAGDASDSAGTASGKATGEGTGNLNNPASDSLSNKPTLGKNNASSVLPETDLKGGKGSGNLNIKKAVKKYAASGILGFGGFILIAGFLVVILYSASDTFSDFFNGIALFFTKDQETLERQYYEELRRVQKKRYKDEGVCVDANLITAALTAETAFSPNPDDTSDEVYDPDSPEANTTPEDEANALDYKRMLKQVELLANMQIKHVKPGWDKRVAKIPGHVGHCRPSTMEAHEEVVTPDTEDDYDLASWPDFDEIIDILKENGFDSSSPEIVARHDANSFSKFFLKKYQEEKNYEYILVQPAATPVCDEKLSDGSCKDNKYHDECEAELEDYAEISIGDESDILNTMDQGVFYWNLVNSFIPKYYSDYLPDEEDPNYKAEILKIADNIYLYYNTMGPNHECTQYDDEDDDDDEDGTDCTYKLGLDKQEFSNIYIKLHACKDEGRFNDLGEPLVEFEKYIAGVTFAENGASPNYEAIKAQAVAARSYILVHNDGIYQDGNKTVIKVRNCTEMQVYCDPDAGCWSKSASNGTVHSGSPPDGQKKPYQHGPLPSNHAARRAAKDTVGQVLVDDAGNIIHTGYNSTIQNKWTSMVGSTYETMLLETYENAAKLSADCKKGGVSGDGTKCGIFTEHTCVNYGDYQHTYWKKKPPGFPSQNPPQCTWYTWGRAAQTLIDDGGMTVDEAYNLLSASQMYRNAGDWYDANAKTKVFDASPNVYDARPGAIIVWKDTHPENPSNPIGHVAFIEAVERDSSGNITNIKFSHGNWKTGQTYAPECSDMNWTIEQIATYNHNTSKTFMGYVYMIKEEDLCGAEAGDWLYVPDDTSTPKPLIVMLPGQGHVKNGLAGDGGRNLYDRFKTEGQKLDAYIYMPHLDLLKCGDYNCYDNNDIVRRIEHVIADGNNNIDVKRISLWGYSQGAISVPNVLNLKKNFFASVVIIAAYSTDGGPFGDIPTYAFAGVSDETYSKTKTLCSNIKNCHFKQLAGGHAGAVERALDEKNLEEGFTSIIDWALSKSR